MELKNYVMLMTARIYRSRELKSSCKESHNSRLLISTKQSYLGMRCLISIKPMVSAVFPCRISLNRTDRDTKGST